MQKLYYGQFGNGRRENKIFTVAAGISITCNFRDSGDDTATAKYYNLRSEAKKISIILNKAAALTHINGKELDFPITLPIGIYAHKGGIEWHSIIVRSDQAATTFEIYAS